MSYKDAQNELFSLVSAQYPMIYVVTDDERPVVETVKNVLDTQEEDFDLFTWSYVGGLFLENNEQYVKETSDPKKVLSVVRKLKKNSVFILNDFHSWFEDPTMVLHLKETIMNIHNPSSERLTMKRYKKEETEAKKTIIITSPVKKIPEEINKLTNVIEFGFPGKEEIYDIFSKLNEKKEEGFYTEKEVEKIVNAGLGLTETEFIQAFTKAKVIGKGKVNHKVIAQEKKQIVEKAGILEFKETEVKLEDVGGMHELRGYVNKRKLAYNQEVRQKWNLDLPKGLLLTGVQGCGKSYTAKAISTFLEFPLLFMDIGSMKGAYVGETEKNIRRATKLADSVSPCVLWIDEIDKAIGDVHNGNVHETTKSMATTLLTWFQEKTSQVFVVATANNLENLPPELLRKGRFDEIFFIDLPEDEERREIFEIHLKKKRQDVSNFDLEKITQETKGFSGSEIQTLVGESLFRAAHLDEDLKTEHLLEEIKITNPLSKTMSDKLDKIRNWAKEKGVRKAN